MWIQQLLFYLFSILLLASAAMVVIAKHPVRAVLFLILSFVASAVLWMLLQAEFLSLALIFVYVGAVMTLFLFVVMMLNVDVVAMREGFVRYLPYGLGLMALFVGMMLMVLSPHHLTLGQRLPILRPADYSNVTVMGDALFTRYLYPLELAAVLLLVAMVAAISLTFHGRKVNTKTQNMDEQQQVNPKDRLRIVSMKSERGR